MNLFSRPCPVCGSTDDSDILFQSSFKPSKIDQFSFSSRKIPENMHFRMVVCPVCDLCYASPILDISVIQKKYRYALFDTSEESHHAAKTYISYLRGIVELLPDLESALDVGAGDGAFLEKLLELGFRDVKGVEPSKASVASAKIHIRPLICKTFFEANAFIPQSLSLITCLQTLEHIENPLEFFYSAYRLLRPGGCLFIVAHNYRSLPARILRHRSPIYDIEHLQLFSERSIRELYGRVCFKRFRVFPIFNRYPVRYWLKLLPFGLNIKKRIINLSQKLSIADIRLTIPAGNFAAIGFKYPTGVGPKGRSAFKTGLPQRCKKESVS